MARSETAEVTSGAATWFRLVSTSVAHMAEHLYIGVLTIVLPVMARGLGMSMAQVGFLVSARYLVAGLSNIPSGLLADLINRRCLLLGLSLGVLGASSLLMSFAADFWTLLALMAFGAIGAGSFHPQSIAILAGAYPARRALALGVHDSAGNLGEVLAPLALGVLLTYTDWRSTLQIWALPGLVVGFSYWLFSAEIDGSAAVRSSLRRSLWEDVITNRAVFGMFLISVLRAMGQTALVAFLPLYLNLHLKLPVGTTGLYVSALFLFAGVAPSVSGWLSDRVGRLPLIIAGSALSALFIAAIRFLDPGIPLLVGCAAVGTALWALRPIIFAAAMEAAPRELAGSIVGFLYTGNMGLSGLAPILAGVTADLYGLEVALPFIGIFPLLAALVALVPWVPRKASRVTPGR